jgi:hypothetical protein
MFMFIYDIAAFKAAQDARKAAEAPERALLDQCGIVLDGLGKGIDQFTKEGSTAGLENIKSHPKKRLDNSAIELRCHANEFELVFIAPDYVAKLDVDDDSFLAARICVYSSLEPEATPVFDIIVQEHGVLGYSCLLRRFISGTWEPTRLFMPVSEESGIEMSQEIIAFFYGVQVLLWRSQPTLMDLTTGETRKGGWGFTLPENQQ